MFALKLTAAVIATAATIAAAAVVTTLRLDCCPHPEAG